MIDCSNPAHDHEAYDDNGMPTAGVSRCDDCAAPMHYDETVQWYQHDGDALDCFLIRRDAAATPCLPPIDAA